MRLYNTLTRSEADFVPADGRTVRMYTCGLTVYARGHIGNFRTFVSLDVLRRALRHQEGYAMHHVMNFTDVDDNPRATDEPNLKAMVAMIQALEARGHTYPSDGSIYFRIATQPDYGKLAHLDPDGIRVGARLDADTYDK